MVKKKRRKKRKANNPSRHHIIPSSRGGTSKLENIARLTVRDHQYYHALFENKIPEEIVQYLVEDYWNGNWDYIIKAYNKYNE